MDRQYEKYRNPISSAIEVDAYNPVTSPDNWVRGNHVMNGYSNFDFSKNPVDKYGLLEPCNGAGLVATDSRIKGNK